jgi:chemotaxis protein histidine kinase CheA/CheY-like chemotaxis protein
MAISPSIREKACQFFIQEAPELLQTIEQELLTLGQQRTPQKVHSLMRAAHSIKGGAANVGLQTICDIAHRLEDSFRALHNQEIVIDSEMEDLLLQGYDCLRIPLMDVVTRGKFNKTAAMRAAEPVFERLEARISGFGPTELPTAAELGVDMTRSIFEVDVAQGLTRMRSVIANRNHPELAGEVRAQAEVFIGLADLLELPGFAEIAQLIIRALDLHPRQAYMIAQVALTDLDRAFDVVMAGDRIRGGEPSAELMLCADLISPQAVAIAPEATAPSEAVAEVEPIALVIEDILALELVATVFEDISIPETISVVAEDFVIAELISAVAEDFVIAEPISAVAEDFVIAEPISTIADFTIAEPISTIAENISTPVIEDISHPEPVAIIAEEIPVLEPVAVIAEEPSIVEPVVEELPVPEAVAIVTEALPTVEPAAEVVEEASVLEPVAVITENIADPEPTIVITESLPIVEPDIVVAENNSALEQITSLFEDIPLLVQDTEASQALSISEVLGVTEDLPKAQPVVSEAVSVIDDVLTLPVESVSAVLKEVSPVAIENTSTTEIVAEVVEEGSTAESVAEVTEDTAAVETAPAVTKKVSTATIEYILPSKQLDLVAEELPIVTAENVSAVEPASQVSEEILVPEIASAIPDSDPVTEAIEASPIPEVSEESPVLEEVVAIAEVTAITEAITVVAEELPAQEAISITTEEILAAEPIAVVSENLPVMEPVSAISEDILLPEALPVVAESVPVVEPVVLVTENLPVAETIAAVAENLPVVEPVVLVAENLPVAEDIEESLPVAQPVVQDVEESLFPEPVSVILEETLVLEPAKAVKLPEPDVVKAPKPVAAELSSVSLEIPTSIPAPAQPVPPPATINVVSQPQNKPEPVAAQPTKLATNAPKAMEAPVPVLDALQEEEGEEENLGTEEESGAARPSVRVDLDRLERLNNQVGELAIAQNGQALQNERLQTTVEQLIERLAKFRKVGAELQGLSDQMLTSPQGNALHVSAFDASFDALELDQYSQLHLLLQAASDEMAQIEESASDIALFAGLSNQSLERQRRMLKSLRDDLMWARMLPLSEILDGFPRALRELSRTYRKPVDLRINGGHVLVDKAALEKLHDPLLHLVRNAFDHGLELPSERKISGKPEVGRIEIRAYHQGGRTVIEVRDDGRGIHYENIRRKAVERNWLTQEQAAAASKPQLLDLLFEPGFSTAAQTTELSGRGVGLDVVRSQLTALKGTITITSEPGKGTTFSLFIPLTLTVAKLMICIAGGTAYALPSDGIETILVPKADQVSESRGQRLLQWRRRLVPMRKLSELLPYNRPVPELEGRDALYAIPLPADWARPVLMLRLKSQVLAVEIDQVVTEQELVIKPISATIAPPGYIYGCTILGDGSVVPVIDGSELLARVLNLGTGDMKIAETPTTPRKALPSARSAMQTVLIVDDSQAMRQTLELTFQTAGYRVLLARDGREGIEQMQKHSEIVLTLCDVEMPNMNGFELLDRHRQDPSIANIPVVMLTSRTGEKHRKMAMHLGATAFVSKPQVEAELVALVAKYITQKPNLTAAP